MAFQNNKPGIKSKDSSPRQRIIQNISKFSIINHFESKS